jgi:hypothetical protein
MDILPMTLPPAMAFVEPFRRTCIRVSEVLFTGRPCHVNFTLVFFLFSFKSRISDCTPPPPPPPPPPNPHLSPVIASSDISLVHASLALLLSPHLSFFATERPRDGTGQVTVYLSTTSQSFLFIFIFQPSDHVLDCCLIPVLPPGNDISRAETHGGITFHLPCGPMSATITTTTGLHS